MLGSRFSLTETLIGIAQRQPDAPIDGPGNAAAALGDHCAELERQMADVARQLHGSNPRLSVRCPVCDSRMQLIEEQGAPDVVAFGVERHALECDTCGLTTMRSFHASQGYGDILR